MSEYYSYEEKTISNNMEKGYDQEEVLTAEIANTQVKRGLKMRHISMISLGGTLGTGLFIGTAGALANAGPVNALIAYLFMASIVFSVAQSLGELATFIPITGSFASFATRFISAPVGAAMGWCYWFSWAITFAIELNTVGLIVNFWTAAVPNAAWIAIFFVILLAVNLFPVKYYGEIEFWVASIKVIAIVGWLIYALCMVCGAGVTGPVGFRYWRNPGPWGGGIIESTTGVYVSNINTSRFLGWLYTLIGAAFTYQGCELVGITAGESANPRKAVPRAINRVFFRILVFYIGSIFFMGLLISYDDPRLVNGPGDATSSPFVIAIVNSGTKVLPHIFNAVILMTLISAGNSNVYIGSRVLYALADSGTAPKFFKITWNGVPFIGVIFTAIFGCLAFLSVSNSSYIVFVWLMNITAVAGMIAWILISVCHIRFMNALKAQGIDREHLPFIAFGSHYYAWYACVANIIIVFIQGFTCFWDFTAAKFFTAYISLVLFFFLWVVFEVVFKIPEFKKIAADGGSFIDHLKLLFRLPQFVKPEHMDLDTGRREADAIVWDDEAPTTILGKVWAFIA